MSMDTANNVVAGAAVTTWVWWPTLNTVSEQAATWLPILGVIWMASQIYTKFVPIIKDSWYKLWK